MKETNPMKFKAIIKKEVFKKNISAQLVMQNYMLERLLIRISLSKYQKNYDYAKQISFKDVCDTLRKIMNIILKDD